MMNEWMTISIGIVFIILSLVFLLLREIILKMARVQCRILEQTYVRGLLILELSGIILVFLGVLKLLGIIT
ncbi:hypothetical protein ES703_14938 [subsurface metagenome]